MRNGSVLYFLPLADPTGAAKTWFTPRIFSADVAQLVERRIRNAQVAGSNPAVGSFGAGNCGVKRDQGCPANFRICPVIGCPANLSRYDPFSPILLGTRF